MGWGTVVTLEFDYDLQMRFVLLQFLAWTFIYTHINVSGKGIEDNVKAYQYVSRYNIQPKG